MAYPPFLEPTRAHVQILPPSSAPTGEVVALSPDLWTTMLQQVPTCTSEAPTRLVVSLSSPASDAKGVIVFAREARGEEWTSTSKLEGSRKLAILISSSFAASNSTLSQASLFISPTQPLILSSLILSARTQAAFDWSTRNREQFEESLEGQVIRQGSCLREGEWEWEVVMAEPVLQGLARRGHTAIYILHPSDARPSTVQEVSRENLEDEDLDIDESFLSNGIFDTFATPSSPWSSSPSIPPTHSIPSSSTLHCRLLPLSSKRPPSPDANIDSISDEHSQIYLSTAALGLLGAFSGDWVTLTDERGNSRLVRAFGSGRTPAIEGESDERTIAAFASPQLVWNLAGSSSSISSLTITISRYQTPSFPTATSVTVTRIASPLSITKTFQPLALVGLKNYFQDEKRVVRKGDIISSVICEDETRFLDGKGEDEEPELLPFEERPTAAVFFRINTIEYAEQDEPFEETDLASGSYGYVVDPKVTKLVQAGVEQSVVPDMAAFLGLHSSRAPADSATSARLLAYLQAALRPEASSYDLHLAILVKGAPGSGKRTLARTVARAAGYHTLELDCFDLVGETDVKTEGFLRARIDKALQCAPCILLLRNIEALARKSQALETGQEPAMANIFKECVESAGEGWKDRGLPVIVIATTSDSDKLPSSVLGSFKEEIAIEAPAESERLSILKALTTEDRISPDVSLRSLAVQTAALVARDLVDLVRRARSAAIDRLVPIEGGADSKRVRSAGSILTAADFNLALEKARSAYSESIGAPKIPSVTWDDVGGLAAVKSDILDTIQLPLEHPELFADGLKKRSGILLYGPPGTGKTLLAKAVATSCSLNFFSVKGPELLNMYIGESEANVRRVFQRARDAKPCVIFFDELDSVAPKRGNQGDSGGVMDRIVSQLLAELDGMAEGKGGSDVFVIGATNRPDLLDPALLRPGRFDRMLYLGVSDNHDSQLKIIQALTRKFRLHPATMLEDVAAMCPFNYTGADFYALCSDAMLKAMARKAKSVEDTIAILNESRSEGLPRITPQYYLAEVATASELEVLVAQEDFVAALAELVPSVSAAEMRHYQVVQQRFSGATMNDTTKGKGVESSA